MRTSVNFYHVAFFLAVLVVAACDKKNDEPAVVPTAFEWPQTALTRSLNKEQLKYIDQTNKFGFTMFAKALEINKGEDILISPLATQMVKAMMINQMDTKYVNPGKEILIDKDFNDYFEAVGSLILNLNNKEMPLGLANAVMFDTGEFKHEFNPETADLFKKDYFTDLFEVNCTLPEGERPGDKWAQEKSKNMIKVIPHIERSSYLDSLQLGFYLSNVFCLSGTLDEEPVAVYDGNYFSVCSLPIKEGPLFLTVIKPEGSSSLADLSSFLDNKMWKDIRNGVVKKDAPVEFKGIDKSFTINNFYDFLDEDFKVLYWNTAGRLNPKNLDELLIDVFLKITLDAHVELKGNSDSKGQTTGNPFIYVISEVGTGLILFMGTFSGM